VNPKVAAAAAKAAAYATGAVMQELEERRLLSAFTPGNLVVYQVGNGSTALTSASTAVYLDEINPTTGAQVQQLTPSTPTELNNPLTASGTASSEGNLTLSQNGQNLLFTGYDAGTGVTTVASTNTVVNTPVTITKATTAGVFTTSGSLAGMTLNDPVTLAGTGLAGVTNGTYYADPITGSTSTFSLYTTNADTTLVKPTASYSATTATFTDANLTLVRSTPPRPLARPWQATIFEARSATGPARSTPPAPAAWSRPRLTPRPLPPTSTQLRTFAAWKWSAASCTPNPAPGRRA
jgi:hypothetical protein